MNTPAIYNKRNDAYKSQVHFFTKDGRRWNFFLPRFIDAKQYIINLKEILIFNTKQMHL